MGLKKPIGWTDFVRFNDIMRRMRVKEFTRLPGRIRAAAIGIIVLGVAATVMLLAAHQSSSTRGNVAKAARAEAIVPTAESPAKPSVVKSTPVTITGCLERDDQTFRLKDTDGANAPKSRSWKTGFLKKGSASIEVVDAANRLKLNDHVGQRVSLTGILVDREMQARLLQRVSPSCANSKTGKSAAL